MSATIEFVAQGGWVRCLVTFPDEVIALATMQRWHTEDTAEGELYSKRWAEESEDHQLPRDGKWDQLLAYLYPQCHHGMSAELCMDPYGPNHFGTMEQELAGIL